jgi:hypothetical protein
MTRKCWGNVAALVAAGALAAGFWWQGERFLAANGPTFDEAVHLAAGYSYWTTGDFRLNREDPPLLKLLWALPLVLGDRPPYPHDVAAAHDNDHWRVGAALLYDSGIPHARLLTPARRVNLAVGCGVVLLAGWWAFRAWGSRLAGLAAGGFAAADPNLLALSCVLSTDVGLTFFALLSAYLLWEYTARPSRGLLLAAGASLGLMLASKLSALGVLAGFGGAAGLIVLRGGVLALPGTPTPVGGWTLGARVRAALDLAFRLGAVAVVVLAATYGFVHFPHWGAGLQFQLTRKDFGNGTFYLCGELSRHGWYHYFLVVLALKLPLGLIAAAGVGTALLTGGRREPTARPGRIATSPPPPVRARSAWLWVAPLVFLAAASYSRVDLGVRVVFPAVAFLYVVAGRLAAPGRFRCLRLLVLADCLAWAVISSAQAAPHQIAYFNELAGGPVGGLRFVADSNLDWGQGLPELKAYTDREGLDVIYLSYFGTARPEAHGIRYQYLPGYGQFTAPPDTVPADAPRHVLAVSANNLIGSYLEKDPDTYAWLRARTPVAVLGGSIYVFDLTGDPDAIRRVRALGPQ